MKSNTATVTTVNHCRSLTVLIIALNLLTYLSLVLK